jgi:hypothetical protein
VHRLSPALTLQGAVAHTDMPAETGPTMYLPHSQKFLPGYLIADDQRFRAHFAANHVQLPLAKGDAVFFNPALLHAAGTNRTADVRRMANLLQVSSAFGRAMEAVDRAAMSAAVYPALRAMRAAGAAPQAVANVIAACAEGYPFPTNLDRDPPVGGMAPPCDGTLTPEEDGGDWPPERLADELSAWSGRGRRAAEPDGPGRWAAGAAGWLAGWAAGRWRLRAFRRRQGLGWRREGQLGQALAWRLRRQFVDRGRAAACRGRQPAVRRPGAGRVGRGDRDPVPAAAPQTGEVARALADGTVIKTWAMRGTLHLLRSTEAPALLSLMARARPWASLPGRRRSG